MNSADAPDSIELARKELRVTSEDENVTSNDEINLVVDELKQLARRANLEFALRVGAVITHHFYGGDTEAWRSIGPKGASFRRLAMHPGLPFSPGLLCRCVAIYELCERLHAPSRWKLLGASHLRAVLGLPHDVQERILISANQNEWTVREIEQAVQREKAAHVNQRGRRAQSLVSKSLKTVRRCLESHRAVLDGTATLTQQEVAETARLIDEIQTSLDAVSQSLHAAYRRR